MASVLPSGLYFPRSGESKPYICKTRSMRKFKEQIKNGDFKDQTILFYSLQYNEDGTLIGPSYRIMKQKFIIENI